MPRVSCVHCTPCAAATNAVRPGLTQPARAATSQLGAATGPTGSFAINPGAQTTSGTAFATTSGTGISIVAGGLPAASSEKHADHAAKPPRVWCGGQPALPAGLLAPIMCCLLSALLPADLGAADALSFPATPSDVVVAPPTKINVHPWHRPIPANPTPPEAQASVESNVFLFCECSVQGVPRWQQRWSTLKVPSAMAPGGGQTLLPEPPCLVPLTMCARCPPTAAGSGGQGA